VLPSQTHVDALQIHASPGLLHTDPQAPQLFLSELRSWHPSLQHVCAPVQPANAPHTQAPFDPHVLVPVHVPQLAMVCVTPQLSTAVIGPHERARRWQTCASVSLVQHAPDAQTWGAAHAPQLGTLRVVPQLSLPDAGPHAFPRSLQSCASVSATHTQTLLALHVWGRLHAPQVTVWLAPQWSTSVTEPHVFPLLAQRAASPS
jgi:hypothetical protein